MRKDLNQHMEELKRCKDEEVVRNIFDDYYGRCD